MTELIEDKGEPRYKITDIIGTCISFNTHIDIVFVGKKDGIGVENLRGSGMIAGETSQAYNEVVTLNLVSIAYTHTHTVTHTHTHCIHYM